MDQLRPVTMELGFTKFAEGSCLIRAGDTVVLCNASVEERVPPHVSKGGWVTAEYSMLPRANRERSKRDVAKLKLAPRSAERTITIDCDVLQGDGGTRTASVTGGFVALVLACRCLAAQGLLEKLPIRNYVAGVSAGIVGGEAMVDLCYVEDSQAAVDFNCVMNGNGNLIEVQGTGEGRPFTPEEEQKLLRLCAKGCRELIALEKKVLGELV